MQAVSSYLPSRGVHNDVPMTWAGFFNRVTGETLDSGETFHEMFHRAPDGENVSPADPETQNASLWTIWLPVKHLNRMPGMIQVAPGGGGGEGAPPAGVAKK